MKNKNFIKTKFFILFEYVLPFDRDIRNLIFIKRLEMKANVLN